MIYKKVTEFFGGTRGHPDELTHKVLERLESLMSHIDDLNAVADAEFAKAGVKLDRLEAAVGKALSALGTPLGDDPAAVQALIDKVVATSEALGGRVDAASESLEGAVAPKA